MNKYLVFFIPIDGKSKDDIKSTEVKASTFSHAEEIVEKTKEYCFQVIGIHLHETCYKYSEKENSKFKNRLKSVNLKNNNKDKN